MRNIKVNNHLVIALLLGMFLIGSIMLKNAIGNGIADNLEGCHNLFDDFPGLAEVCFKSTGDVVIDGGDWDIDLDLARIEETNGWGYYNGYIPDEDGNVLGRVQVAGGFYPAVGDQRQWHMWVSGLSYVEGDNQGTAVALAKLPDRPQLGGGEVEVGGDNLGAVYECDFDTGDLKVNGRGYAFLNVDGIEGSVEIKLQ